MRKRLCRIGFSGFAFLLLAGIAAADDLAAVFNQNMNVKKMVESIRRDGASVEVATVPAEKMNAASSKPLHGIWVDMKLLQLDKPELARFVRLARAAGLQTLYPAVFRYGCNFYKASASPFDCGKEDLLGKFIAVVREEAPEMRVVPWFERTIQIGALTPKSLADNTSVQEPPNAKTHGYRIVDLDNALVRAHLLQSVLALRSYGLRSVQIDDHLAYDAVAGDGDNEAFRSNPAAWRAKLTRFVNWLTAQVHERDPGFRVEIAQNPADFADANYLADWKNWKVDGVVVECYRSSGYAAAMDPKCGNGRRGVAFLANGKQLSDEEILTAARALRNSGIVLFHLGSLKDRENLVTELGSILRP